MRLPVNTKNAMRKTMRTDYTYELHQLILGEDEGYDLLEHLTGVNKHPDVARSVAYNLAMTMGYDWDDFTLHTK